MMCWMGGEFRLVSTSILLMTGICLYLLEKLAHEFAHKMFYAVNGVSSRIKINIKKGFRFQCEIPKEHYRKFDNLSIKSKAFILLSGPGINGIFALAYTICFFFLRMPFQLLFLILLLISLISFLMNIFCRGSDYWYFQNFKQGKKIEDLVPTQTNINQ